MSENRFLQTFYAVAASAVLVCSTMLFLVATSEWGHPTSDKDASVPTRVAAAQLSTRSEAEPIARLPIDPPSAAPSLASDQVDFDYTASTADQVAEPGASVQGEMSSPETDASVRPDSATRGTALSPSPADAPSDEVGRDPATEEDAIASDAVEDASPEVTIAEPSQPTSPAAGDASIAASVEQSATEEATPPATPQVAEAKGAEPSQSQNALTSDASKAETVEQPITQAETPPASPPMDEAKIAEPSPPASSIASDANKDASVEAAGVAQATPEAATLPASSLVAEMKIAEPSQPASPVAGDASKAASVEPATKPAARSPAKLKVAEVGPPPKPAARPNQAQEASSQSRGKAPWKAMSLAPADKPSISLSKVPTSRPSASGYRAQIWSALARHKPKAGQRGSATVIFAIGQNGALRGVRVGRSSGNTRLDQLALATVRNAAPYPAPPGGAQSFMIRIDFH